MTSTNGRPIQQLNKKRSNKPLMERKRRERINKSLDELKEIILKAEHKDVSKYSKLEKADILEMAVKHVVSLHQNSVSADSRSKFGSGFSQCTAEVESYLMGIQGFPTEIAQGLMTHLHNVLNSVAKENIPVHTATHKIKATTDRSILTCRTIRSNQPQPLEPIHEQTQNFPEFRIETQPQGMNSHCPMSPPEERPLSMSPYSPRLSPNSAEEFQNQQKFAVSLMNIMMKDRQEALTCGYVTRETAPLNLTLREPLQSPLASKNGPLKSQNSPPLPSQIRSPIPFSTTSQTSPSPSSESGTSPPLSHQSRHSLSLKGMPRAFAVQESPSTPHLPPSPPSERFSPLTTTDRDNALSTSPCVSPLAQSFKVKERPTPYPKKDAVKRYQNESQLIEGGENPQYKRVKLEYFDESADSHWRPWAR